LRTLCWLGHACFMNDRDFVLFDWHRLLLGPAPWIFLVEVAGRTLVVYCSLLLAVRLLGKRLSAQATIAEMAVMLALGAIVAVPMQTYDRGIVPGLVVLTTMLGLHSLVGRLAFRSDKVARIVQGQPSILVRDGALVRDEMRSAAISREQLFAKLREAQIHHLGELKRVYLEPSGEFSIIKRSDPIAGDSVLPDQDATLRDEEKRTARSPSPADQAATEHAAEAAP
jgi:uncharacterized membrane protein YcaP (DUF421 family)